VNTKDLLKTIILENEKMILPTIWKRTLELPLDTDKIISLSGVRFGGKTWLLLDYIKKLLEKGISRESILYFNCEDERIERSEESLNLLITTYQELHPDKQLSECYFILDEIQKVPLGSKIRFLTNLYDRVSKRIVIAGSNKSLIPVNEKLGLDGNVIFFELYPLSFRELVSITYPSIDPTTQESKNALSALFLQFQQQGGFPAIIGKDKATRTMILQECFNTIIQRDLINNFYIPDPDILRYFCRYIIARSAKKYCIHQLFRELSRQGLWVKKDYLYYFDSFLSTIYLNHTINHKTYLIDQGLGAAIDYDLANDNKRLLENTVYLELIKQGKETTELEVSRILNQNVPLWQNFL
jgi:predicted AAA+ superfamily ATPase